MKSTGEVMGTAGSFGKAYQKAQMCVGKDIPLDGTALVDFGVRGYEDHFDVVGLDDYEDTEAVVEAIQAGDIDLVASRDRDVLEACVEETVTYFSTRESTEAALEAINSDEQPLAVQAVSERPKTTREWGSE
jgi:carbamoyl-phosphate synthase large subunit